MLNLGMFGEGQNLPDTCHFADGRHCRMPAPPPSTVAAPIRALSAQRFSPAQSPSGNRCSRQRFLSRRRVSPCLPWHRLRALHGDRLSAEQVRALQYISNPCPSKRGATRGKTDSLPGAVPPGTAFDQRSDSDGDDNGPGDLFGSAVCINFLVFAYPRDTISLNIVL